MTSRKGVCPKKMDSPHFRLMDRGECVNHICYSGIMLMIE